MDNLIYAEMLSAAYFLWMAVAMHTRNIRSGLIFKTLPLFMGLALALDVFSRSGWVLNV